MCRTLTAVNSIWKKVCSDAVISDFELGLVRKLVLCFVFFDTGQDVLVKSDILYLDSL